MKKLRRITEAEVIAEFLKAEFFHKEYDFDRDLFADIVRYPDLTNDAENALRRALFYRRRGAMWWELPEDRQWWDIELEPADMERVSVFPRAHWVRLSGGDFRVRSVAERVRQRVQGRSGDGFADKMSAIGSHIRSGGSLGSVIFIGVNDFRRLVILEGNHRFVATLLDPGKVPATMRLVAGFSPHMERCCWYKTNFVTLCRCLKNRIQHYWDRDADVAELLDQTVQARTSAGYVKNADPVKSKVIP
jgi:hypothetical protein